MTFGIQDPRITEMERKGYIGKEPQIVAYCDGCGEGIYKGDDVYEFEDVILHQNSECCENYISNFAVTRVAGE